MIFTVENCSQFRFHFPAIILITFNNQTIVDFKTNFVARKVRCVLFPKRVLYKLYGFSLNLKPLTTSLDRTVTENCLKRVETRG